MKIKKSSSAVEQQNVITTASHTARTATLNINPIQTYVTHSLPRWIKRMFFFSCFPSCLPKKNARGSENTFELWLYNRRRCCIETGSRQEKKNTQKKNVQTLESIAIHRCYQQYFPPPSPPFSRPPKWHQVCCPPPASFLCVAK